ncbi:RnfH family protein [Ferriphaselus sp. R-1]|uniref:RnfH family protein n=1 Tax=Ferriphaselus sp. R-1 TaxID=1485544 RepID=UPI000553A99F|nr:RnfH family protein [Ferriphaselus sp. R-1]
MPDSNKFTIEVVYALPHEQTLLKVQVPPGTTLDEGVRQSGILEKYPEIDLDKGKFGIFGKLSKTDTELRELDRIEIYRPLLADPKEVRKRRAEEGKVMKKGGGDA